MGDRVPVIQRPAYSVSYEMTGRYHLGHVRVTKWSAPIARQFRKDIDTAQSLLGADVFVVVPADRPNLPKFLRMHGWDEVGTVINQHGLPAPLFMRPPPHG